jgi:hypothetical protein
MTIYTEQGWKMTIVYTVGEISNNNIKIYTVNLAMFSYGNEV